MTSKVAIVTGVSKGYGQAVANLLLSEGWSVVGDARNSEELAKSAAAAPRPEALQAIPGDIREESHLLNMIEAAKHRGALSLIVNSAGTLGPSPLPMLAEVSTHALVDVFETNVAALLRLIQLALPEIKANNGVVVNLTSDAAAEAYEGWGVYGASKIALEKVTSVLSVENPDLRFYSLDPGDMRTEMHQAAFPGEDISDRPDPSVSAPAILKLAAGDLPSGRYVAADLIS